MILLYLVYFIGELCDFNDVFLFVMIWFVVAGVFVKICDFFFKWRWIATMDIHKWTQWQVAMRRWGWNQWFVLSRVGWVYQTIITLPSTTISDPWGALLGSFLFFFFKHVFCWFFNLIFFNKNHVFLTICFLKISYQSEIEDSGVGAELLEIIHPKVNFYINFHILYTHVCVFYFLCNVHIYLSAIIFLWNKLVYMNYVDFLWYLKFCW